MNAFGIIAFQQGRAGFAADHMRQLPAQIVDIMHAAIAAARAKGGYHMRRIPDKDHPVMDKAVDSPAVEAVDRYPVQLEGASIHNLFDTRDDIFRLLFLFRVSIGPQLQVNPVDIVRLLVQQCGLPGMECRGKPEPAFRRKIGLHLDIGDQEPLFKIAAFKIQAEMTAQTAVGTVTGQQVITFQPVGAIWCLDLCAGTVIILRDRQHTVLEPQVNQVREISAAFDQILLDIILLQIDESRKFVAVLGQQVKAVNLRVTAIDPAKLPGHALFQHSVGNTQPVKNLETALCPADGAAADRHNIIVIDHGAGDAMRRKIDCSAQTNRSGPDNDDRGAGNGIPLQLGRDLIVKRRILISCHGACPFCLNPSGSGDSALNRSAGHSTFQDRAPLSRCAVYLCLSPRQRRGPH